MVVSGGASAQDFHSDSIETQSSRSVKERVAQLESSPRPANSSPGTILRDMSRKVKAIKDAGVDSTRGPPSRALERKTSRRGDDPMPRELPTQEQSEKSTQPGRSSNEQSKGEDEASRRLELLEARSRSLLDVRMTDSEAEQCDLVELISKQKWKYVLDRVNQQPDEASRLQDVLLDGAKQKESVETRALPLHKALCVKPPLHVVETLLAAYPDAVKISEEKWGRLPIHMALLCNANSQILKLLMVSYPLSLHMEEKKDGRIPLHLACLFGSPYEVSLLLTADENTIDARDGHGKTPIELSYDASDNPHREAIMKRLHDKSQAMALPASPRKNLEKGASNISPGMTDGHNKSKSARWKWRQGNPDTPKVPVLPDLVNEKPRSAQKSSRSLSMTTGMPESRSKQFSVENSSRSIFRRSRAKSMGHGVSDTGTREKGFLSRFQRQRPSSQKETAPRRQHKSTASSVSGTESVGDAVTVASMPSIFPYSPSTNIAQFSVDGTRKEESRMETSAGTDELSGFLEKTKFETKFDRDIQSLPQSTPPERKKKKKKRRDSTPSDQNQALARSAFRPISSAEADDFIYTDTAVSRLSELGVTSSNLLSPHLSPHGTRTQGGGVTSFEPTPIVPLSAQQPQKDLREAESRQSDSSTDAEVPLHPSSDQLIISLRAEQEPANETMNEAPSVQDDGSQPKAPSVNLLLAAQESEIAALESQLHHLDIRREALAEECNHVSEAILLKRESADKAQRKIQATQQKLAELQHKLVKEQAVLDQAESRIQIHLETLEDHQTKLKGVNEEMNVLLSIKKSLMADGAGKEEDVNDAKG